MERLTVRDLVSPPVFVQENALIDDLFREQKKVEAAFFSKEKFMGKVGAFEGAAYEAKGLYRSSADCIMFTRTDAGFCPVCRRAIEKVIDSYR